MGAGQSAVRSSKLLAIQYDYEKLEDQASWIRLMRCEYDPASNVLWVTTTATTLELAPDYYAISYSWGDTTTSTTISINGVMVDVHQNCYYALRQASQRRPGSFMWIDAICINHNDSKEKNSQVRLMGQIFQSAIEVLASIGPHENDSEYFVSRIQNVPKCSDTLLAEREHYLHDFRQADSRVKNAMTSFLGRSYWTRLWVIPELTLASGIVLMCGYDEIDFNILNTIALLEKSTDFWDINRWHPFCKLMSFRHSFSQRRSNVDHLFEWTTQSLVSNFRWFKCADPRDRIFAMADLIDLPAEVSPILPDYDISEHELIVKYLRHSSSDTRYGTTFSYVDELHMALQVPPDFEILQQKLNSTYNSNNQEDFSIKAKQNVVTLGRMLATSSAARWPNTRNLFLQPLGLHQNLYQTPPDVTLRLANLKDYLRERCWQWCQLGWSRQSNKLMAPLQGKSILCQSFSNLVQGAKKHRSFQEVAVGAGCFCFVTSEARAGDYLIQVGENTKAYLVVRHYDGQVLQIVGQAIISGQPIFKQQESADKPLTLWLSVDDALLLYAERHLPDADKTPFEVANIYTVPVTTHLLSSFAVFEQK